MDFDFFDGIFCINLDRRVDRWEICQKEFDRIGINHLVERVSGIEHARPNIGCHLSHAKCLSLAKQRNYTNCLIFEDDIDFFFEEDETKNKIKNSISDLPKDWALFYLGINMDRFCAHKITENLAKLDGGFSTHAIAVNNILFDELITINCDESIAHNDVHYSYYIMPNYNCYVTIPLLAGQRDSFSDVQGRIMSSNQMFKERFKDKLLD